MIFRNVCKCNLFGWDAFFCLQIFILGFVTPGSRSRLTGIVVCVIKLNTVAVFNFTFASSLKRRDSVKLIKPARIRSLIALGKSFSVFCYCGNIPIVRAFVGYAVLAAPFYESVIYASSLAREYYVISAKPIFVICLDCERNRDTVS